MRTLCRQLQVWVYAFAMVGMAVSPVQAARPDKAPDKAVEIPVGASQTIRVPSQIDRVVVGDPQVCDVVSLPPGQLLLTAKSPGETQITVWSREGGANSYHIIASIPTSALQQAFKEAFPNEEDLSIHATGGAVYITGNVADASVVESAQRLAQSMLLTQGRKVAEIINLASSTSSHQVQLGLRFVDISRTSLREMGLNAWYQGQHTTAFGVGPNNPTTYQDVSVNFPGQVPINGNPNVMPLLVSPIQGSFALGLSSGQFGPLSATLSVLESNGVAKTLSEPTLVATSGEKANFLVGGEFPIPVPDALGRTIIQFKPYGVELAFTPVVIGQETMHLDINAAVSQIDKANGVPLGASVVPALAKRQSSTAVRLRDGQSFAIAGLLNDAVTTTVSKVPLLGDIPVVGMLFRNVSYQRDERELIVIVTGKLVKPMEPGEVPSIVEEDEWTDPNDAALFLLGSNDFSKLGDTSHVTPARRGSHADNAAAGGAIGFSR